VNGNEDSTPLLGRGGMLLVNVLTLLFLLLAAFRAVPAAGEARELGHARTLSAAAAGRPTLLVLFQDRDCSSAGRFVTDWRRLTAEGSVRVIAVPVNVRSDAGLAEVIAQFPPDFDVRPELGGAAVSLLRRFRAPYTPVAVLLDPGGRPRMLIPQLDASLNQLEVQAAVTTYLTMLRES
jgi:hypothetical protein